GAVGEGGVDEGGHDVGGVELVELGLEGSDFGGDGRPGFALADGADVVEGLGDGLGVAAFLEVGEALVLLDLDVVGDLEDVDGALLVGVGVGVDADDDAVAGLALLGEAVGGLGDLAAEVALVDAVDDAAGVGGAGGVHAGGVAGRGLRVAGWRGGVAHRVDFGDVFEGGLLHGVGEVLDEPGAAEGIGDAGDAGFVGEDLLGAEGDGDGLLGGEAEGLVHGVGVEGLAAAEDGGHGLVGDADDVVQGLLLGEGASGGLDVGLHVPGPLVPGAVALAHHAGPDAAG